MGGNSLTLGRLLPRGDGLACAIGEIKIHQYPTLLRRRAFKELQKEDKVMAKLFDIENVVVAEVVTVVHGKGYAIARNCEEKMIFCHFNDGGKLSVTREFRVTFSYTDELTTPPIHGRIALIREKRDGMKFDKGVMWVPIADWNDVSWVTQLEDVFRVVMFNHTIDGDPAPNNTETIVMEEGTLQSIITKILEGENDLGKKIITSNLGGKVLSSHVGWDILRKDKWTTCRCPLPRHLQR